MSSNITNTNTNTASVAAVAISAQTYSSRMSEVKCSNEAVINLTAKSKLDYKSNKTGNDNKNFDSELDATNASPINHPKYAQFFKKRVCFKFVKDPKSNLCAGCMHKETEGAHEKISLTEWNYKTCTRLCTTDAYGKLNFPGSHSKTASYIRVQNETKTKDMIQYLYSSEGWNLQKPQLILSVTGGAQKFTIPLRMKKAFKRGLIKAAASTGAWIITGGTNTGVMRLVGEAVADEFHTCNITVLGIATWGKIAFRDQMIRKNSRSLNTAYSLNEINKEAQQVKENGNIYKKEPLFYAEQESDENRKSQTKNTDVLLDPNHTHFILVDDGSEGQFGKEIEFRAHLEAELRKGKSPKFYETRRSQSRKKNWPITAATNVIAITGSSSAGGIGGSSSNPTLDIDLEEMDDCFDDDNSRNESVPMILIVVQGGPNTLLTVEESLKQNVPVLVLADSKGCADLIANACSASNPDHANLEKLLIESKMFANRVGFPDYVKVTTEAIKRLEYIISKISHNLINVFHLDSEEGGSDIELTILRAFLNSRKNQYYENLKLALQWNRSDIAKTDIFTGEEEFKPYQLANLMEMALIQNKPEFVELLLENGLNLKSFLTVRRLCFLYNSNKIQSDARKQPLFQLYKKKYSPDNSVKMRLTITFKGLMRFLKDFVFEDFEPCFLPTDLDSTQLQRFLHYSNKNESSDLNQIDSKDTTLEVNFGKNEVLYPQQNLFLWALLLNRIDIAKLFWQIDEHQICSALFASKLLKSMSKRLTDLEKELARFANYFEEMAIGVLNIFDATTDDLINGVILLRKIPFYNLDCLQMSVIADCKTFVSLSSVQNLLTDIWHGKIIAHSGWKAGVKFMLSCISFGFLAPYLIFDRREKFSNLNDRENMLKKLATYSKKKNITDIFESFMLGYTRSNLLRDYLTNYEITIDKKESNLLPSFCITDTSSCSSSSDESTDSELFKTEINSFSSSKKQINQISSSHKRTKKYTKKAKKNDKQTKWTTYWNRYKRFLHSPYVHFIYDTIFSLLFLILFSYMMLCEFTYYEKVKELVEVDELFNQSETLISSMIFRNNRTYMYMTRNRVKSPSWIEYLLVFWAFAFLVEEIRQYFSESETKILNNRLKHYFENSWNYIDLSGCLVFGIGIALRFTSIRTNESMFKAARIVLCVDLIIYYIRLLHFFYIFKSLGPKLVMIVKMARDLIFFISIIIIFICAFGVVTQATLYPGNKLNFELIRNIFDKAYWPIYGELKILQEMEECQLDEFNAKVCPDSAGVTVSYMLLVFYMLIANILLINLLIAMFSSTFQEVQENTDKIWKFQRYRFIFEYYDSPILPPPLNFIAYMISSINYLKNKSSEAKKFSKSAISLHLQSEELYDSTAKDEVDLLLDRERKYAEEYLRMEKFKKKESMDSRLKSNVEKLETLEQKLNEVMEARFRESNQLTDAINWIMTQMENEKRRAPLIKNVNSNRKTK